MEENWGKRGDVEREGAPELEEKMSSLLLILLELQWKQMIFSPAEEEE